MPSPIKIGCLGAARITPLAVLDPAKAIRGVEVSAIAARDRSRAQQMAAAHGIAKVHDSYDALIADPDLTLIYNPLPINLHAEWSIKALKAGKHVLCEKPFAMNAGEVEAMQAAAKASGRRIIEAFHHCYHPTFNEILLFIRGGGIGDLKKVDCQFCIGIDDRGGKEIRHLPETGGGAFMDLGCYPLSWALAVCGAEPVAVEASATLTSRGVDETLKAFLRFDTGVEADLIASMAPGRPYEAPLTITGSKGTVHLLDAVQVHRAPFIRIQTEYEEWEWPVSPMLTYLHQMSTLVHGLQTETPLPTEGDFPRQQQRTLDRIYQAAGLGHLRENGA